MRGEPERPTWAEIDLAALRGNLARLRAHASQRRIIAVIKADAYGHGAPAVAAELARAGAEMLAVALVEEARELSDAAPGLPVLLLEGLHRPEQAAEVLGSSWRPAVGRADVLDALEAAARAAKRACAIHLKFDTGMGRLGFPPEDCDAVFERVARSPDLLVEGLMSHLAEADDPGATSVARQREAFSGVVGRAREHGLEPDWIHLDNSAGLLNGPSPATTAVRPGIALYGVDPTRSADHELEPVMTLRTRVLHAKTVTTGTRVGYGGEFVAPGPTRILTLPLGYADGLPRAAGGRYSVGLGGSRVPLVGRVSMDLATADAGDSGATASADAGQEVLIFGRAADLLLRVEELAAAVDTIAYEILVGIGPRVPRIIRSTIREE